MKKIIFILTILTTVTSCFKEPQGCYYQGIHLSTPVKTTIDTCNNSYFKKTIKVYGDFSIFNQDGSFSSFDGNIVSFYDSNALFLNSKTLDFTVRNCLGQYNDTIWFHYLYDTYNETHEINTGNQIVYLTDLNYNLIKQITSIPYGESIISVTHDRGFITKQQKVISQDEYPQLVIKKYDKDGNLTWTQDTLLTGLSPYNKEFCFFKNGDIIEYGLGYHHINIYRLGTNGNIIWNKQYNHYILDKINFLFSDKNDNIICFGESNVIGFIHIVDSSGNEISYNETHDVNMRGSGSFFKTYNDYFLRFSWDNNLVKTNNKGDLIWSKKVSASNHFQLDKIYQTSSGNIYIVGQIEVYDGKNCSPIGYETLLIRTDSLGNTCK